MIELYAVNEREFYLYAGIRNVIQVIVLKHSIKGKFGHLLQYG